MPISCQEGQHLQDAGTQFKLEYLERGFIDFYYEKEEVQGYRDHSNVTGTMVWSPTEFLVPRIITTSL